jgi:hypothetical protein
LLADRRRCSRARRFKSRCHRRGASWLGGRSRGG